MINQRRFFEAINFADAQIEGQEAYIGTDHHYYRLKETDQYFYIFCAETREQAAQGEFIEIDAYERVLPENEMIMFLKKAMLNRTNPALPAVLPEERYDILRDMVRQAIGKPLGMKEINNICKIYDFAVRKGSIGLELAETCKDVLMLMEYIPDPSIKPELHRMLLQVPDVYYMFLLGVENDLLHDDVRQERLLYFMKNNPGLMSPSIVEYTSLMNQAPGADDRKLARAVEIFDKENLKWNEGSRWTVRREVIQDKGYTFRYMKSVCFVDYMNKCIGSGCLRRYHGSRAELVYIRIAGEEKYPGVREALLKQLEEIACRAGVRSLLLYCGEDLAAFYQENGFRMGKPEDFKVSPQDSRKTRSTDMRTCDYVMVKWLQDPDE